MLRSDEDRYQNACLHLAVLLLSLVSATPLEESGSLTGDYVPLVIWHGMGEQLKTNS